MKIIHNGKVINSDNAKVVFTKEVLRGFVNGYDEDLMVTKDGTLFIRRTAYSKYLNPHCREGLFVPDDDKYIASWLEGEELTEIKRLDKYGIFQNNIINSSELSCSNYLL